jgi:hypothetical protein
VLSAFPSTLNVSVRSIVCTSITVMRAILAASAISINTSTTFGSVSSLPVALINYTHRTTINNNTRVTSTMVMSVVSSVMCVAVLILQLILLPSPALPALPALSNIS